MIPIYKPYLEKYKTSAISAIKDEWVSNHGINIELASNKLCNILNIKYCILMNNGTSATQCLFKALKYKYPDIKKIYIPNNVFIAPWNCCLIEYSEDIIEVMKMNENTLNIDTSEEYIKNLDNNSAVLIVHNLGNIVNVPRLRKIRPDIIFIEDNCEGLFGSYEDKYSGTESLCSAVSFYGNKILTTGEGGAFFTNDYDIYNYIKNIYSHGMSNVRYIHNNIGYNFRMTNVQAGLLYDQLNDYKHILELKNNVFNTYDLLLSDLLYNNTISKLNIEAKTLSAPWMYTLIIKNIPYDIVEAYMTKYNIDVRPFFYDIHCHTHLKNIHNQYKPLLNTQNGVMLPSYPTLEYKQQEYICNIIKNMISEYDIKKV